MQLMNSSRFKMQISGKAHGVIAFELRQGHYENKLISGQNWQNRAGKDTEWQHRQNRQRPNPFDKQLLLSVSVRRLQDTLEGFYRTDVIRYSNKEI
ncbi:hypothetical protein BOTCAL_0011g00030 [Botryotinia calthae]|uniref:Uncharacterized protein n=1 Tax=Botryotinia calthae TaxID=38488 RepID=A0A4Y8DIE9_9HELO|nr:hypothetical protein BOTCAL_0011g00030 [Botryotinia calthae]